MTIVLLQISFRINGERILKFHQHLAMLLTKNVVGRFYDSQYMYMISSRHSGGVNAAVKQLLLHAIDGRCMITLVTLILNSVGLEHSHNGRSHSSSLTWKVLWHYTIVHEMRFVLLTFPASS